VEAALDKWERVRRTHPVAVIEILDSDVYVEQLAIELHRGESVEIRRRPIARARSSTCWISSATPPMR